MASKRVSIRFKSLGASSAKYGSCEVCKLHVSETWMRAESTGNCAFGHEACLRGPLAASVSW